MRFWPFGRKKQVQQKRQYAASIYNRLVGDWVAQLTSIDSEIKGGLRNVRARAREQERNNDLVRSYLREVQNNVVGQGIPFQSQVKMQRGGKPNEKVNSQIEDAWGRWCRKDSCDTSGKRSFSQIERLLIRSTARDGEIIVRLITQKFGRSKVPLGLEVIESDRLDENYMGISDAGNEIRMGVEIDKWGRPVNYYFWAQHPGDYPFSGQKVASQRHIVIPADEIIHLFIPERAGQTRGFPWIASAMMRLHQMQGYEEAEVIGARAAASIMGFIQSPEGQLIGDGVDQNERVTDMAAGTYKYLNPGETVSMPTANRPSGTFEPFMTTMTRFTAAGIGMSYESLSKDYSRSNYSASRLALISDRDNWRVIQQWMIDHFHQIVFEKWLDMATLSGELQLPGYEVTPELYAGVRWMPRGWAWIDPAKEVLAYKEATQAGFKSVSEIIAQEGDDVEEKWDQISRERELAKSKNLIFDSDFANLQAKLPLGDAPKSM